LKPAADKTGAPEYPLSAYDAHFCLKPGLVLWLVIAFLARAYVVTIVSFTRRAGSRMELIDLVYSHRATLALAALAALPAVACVYAYVRRAPGAQPRDRALWHAGRWLLLASALVNLGVVTIPVAQHLAQVEGWRLLELVVSAWVLIYLAVSRRVRQTFAEYPETPQEDRPVPRARRRR